VQNWQADPTEQTDPAYCNNIQLKQETKAKAPKKRSWTKDLPKDRNQQKKTCNQQQQRRAEPNKLP